MSTFLPRGRERILWLVVASYVLAIYGSAYFVRFASDHLRERGVLGATVAGLGMAGAAAFLVWWRGRAPGIRSWLLLAVAGSIYAGIWLHLERFEERLHLLQYGLLGVLLYQAMVMHWDPRRVDGPLRRSPALAAFLLATAAGWVDEVVQYLLPNRYYDIRDVLLNAASAGLAIGLVAVRRRTGDTPLPYNDRWPAERREETD